MLNNFFVENKFYRKMWRGEDIRINYTGFQSFINMIYHWLSDFWNNHNIISNASL